MKKIMFTDKSKNVVNEMFAGNVGEAVFPLCQNVKETNDAIRWCNTHKAGDVFECDLYKIEITNN